MTKPINKHPYRIGNEHGEIKFGHIIKEKQFGYTNEEFRDEFSARELMNELKFNYKNAISKRDFCFRTAT